MRVCYNRKYSAVSIYHDTTWGSREYKGQLYPGEAFFVDEGEGGMVIHFRGSTGAMNTCYLNVTNAENAINQFVTDIMRSPYSTESINGVDYVTFKFRQRMPIYDINGYLWDYVEAGQRVAIKASNYNSQTGSNKKPYCLLCEFVERQRDGQWIKIGGSHGFVNVGIDTIGSEATKLPLVGGWNR